MQLTVSLIALILRLSMWLAASLAIILGLTALRLIPSDQRWLLKFCFAVATGILLIFAVAFLAAVQHYGGFGLSPSGFIAISVLSVETGILGVLAFQTTFRLLPLIFIAIGLIVILYFIFHHT